MNSLYLCFNNSSKRHKISRLSRSSQPPPLWTTSTKDNKGCWKKKSQNTVYYKRCEAQCSHSHKVLIREWAIPYSSSQIMFFTLITCIAHFLYLLVVISYSLHIFEDNRTVVESLYVFNFLTRERFKFLIITNHGYGSSIFLKISLDYHSERNCLKSCTSMRPSPSIWSKRANK